MVPKVTCWVVNVAVAVTFAVTVKMHVGLVVPGHTPLQETNEAPCNGIALSEMLVFAGKFRTPPGLTLPAPTTTVVTVNC